MENVSHKLMEKKMCIAGTSHSVSILLPSVPTKARILRSLACPKDHTSVLSVVWGTAIDGQSMLELAEIGRRDIDNNVASPPSLRTVTRLARQQFLLQQHLQLRSAVLLAGRFFQFLYIQAGWWFGTFFIPIYWEYSSQLTKYVSEGLFYHQPARRWICDDDFCAT